MAQAIAEIQDKTDTTLAKTQQVLNRNIVTDVYLKTNTGVVMLMGRDGDEIREKIKLDKDHIELDYRFFDDDRRKWAYWAVRDSGGTIKPLAFPNPTKYSLTSSQLYTKAVAFVHILAHMVGLLKDKPPTLWDKMLKPTTIIVAIVGVVFIMGLILVASSG